MRFSTRNAFYLRASNYRVVPLFLYLDERHVDWMSDKVLQLVIADMKDKMEHLLTVEKSDKKHRVHVERGGEYTYQYCYFLRKTTRTEVVLLKNKTFSLRAPTPPPRVKVGPSRKRKATATLRSRSRRARLISEGVMPDDMSDDDDYDADDADDDYEEEEDGGDEEDADVVVKDEPRDPGDEDELDELDEAQETAIKDWKPDVSLSYQGFGTTSVQLVLIIEPYPPLPASQYAPPASRLSSRSASILSSRSRSRSQLGTGRYTSLAPGSSSSATPLANVRNMRNPTRSASVATPAPSSSRRGRSSSRYESATPGPGSSTSANRARQTPLFIPHDTPFGDDEEDEEAHEQFAQALREGRWRLPSVVPRDADDVDEEDENPDDAPEGMMAIGERLVRASVIEEGVVRNAGGWEERLEGEESAVLGREEPGD